MGVKAVLGVESWSGAQILLNREVSGRGEEVGPDRQPARFGSSSSKRTSPGEVAMTRPPVTGRAAEIVPQLG